MKNEGEQITLFDQDIWYGKTSPEPYLQTEAKISAPSSKKPRGSSRTTPLFLDLRGERNGVTPEPYWATGGPLLGVYTTRSFGESPSEENGSLLSQILEEEAHPRYYLSAKACKGILNRAEKRGKKLPEILAKALEEQAKE